MTPKNAIVLKNVQCSKPLENTNPHLGIFIVVENSRLVSSVWSFNFLLTISMMNFVKLSSFGSWNSFLFCVLFLTILFLTISSCILTIFYCHRCHHHSSLSTGFDDSHLCLKPSYGYALLAFRGSYLMRWTPEASTGSFGLDQPNLFLPGPTKCTNFMSQNYNYQKFCKVGCFSLCISCDQIYTIR